MARRSKDNRILIRVGADAAKRLARNAAMEKAASDRAARRAEKKARTAQNSSMKELGKRAAQIARRLARDRATQERRLAKRKEKEAQRNQNPDKPKRKKPYHPRSSSATENYTSYARRFERSKRLKATRTSPTTFVCNGYTIKVTAGASPKALSCTCADFTQVEGGKSWKGSSAGPFNPCKHMMAVEEKWACSNGICSPSPSGIYKSQAQCQAALIPPQLIGGQCPVPYTVTYRLYVTNLAGVESGFPSSSNRVRTLTGAILGLRATLTNLTPTNGYESVVFAFNTTGGTFGDAGVASGGGTGIISARAEILSAVRVDGLPDDCGNLPSTCP